MNKNSRYTVSRDRMAELRGAQETTESSDDFGPNRVPLGYQVSPASRRSLSSEAGPRRYAARRQDQQITTPASTESQHAAQGPGAAVPLETMDDYLKQVDCINAKIRETQSMLQHISELHDASLVAINETQARKNSQALEQAMDQVMKQNQAIKFDLQNLEQSNRRQKASDLHIRKTQAARLRKDFIEVIKQYQAIEHNFAQKYRQRVERQIRIVKPDATDDQINAIIDSEQENHIFASSLMQTNKSGQAKEVLNEVQSRHQDIKQIERTIVELQRLFMDMQMLVEHQGETLDVIEQHAEKAVEDIENGVHQVDRAIKSARSARAKKWCCFVIFIIILIVAAILIWWFAFNHKGVGNNP